MFTANFALLLCVSSQVRSVASVGWHVEYPEGFGLFLVRPMTGAVRIAVLMVRVAGRHPMTVSMRRVTVIAANPDILPISPFVMARDPDRRVIGSLPLMVFSRRRRSLGADMDGKGGIC